MLAFKYISLHYLKYFIIILIALVMFMVGFDYMQNAQQLSKSANLILIYLVYRSFFAIDMLLPLALIFSMISTKYFNSFKRTCFVLFSWIFKNRYSSSLCCRFNSCCYCLYISAFSVYFFKSR
jgi:hypothetical protein